MYDAGGWRAPVLIAASRISHHMLVSKLTLLHNHMHMKQSSAIQVRRCICMHMARLVYVHMYMHERSGYIDINARAQTIARSHHL